MFAKAVLNHMMFIAALFVPIVQRLAFLRQYRDPHREENQ